MKKVFLAICVLFSLNLFVNKSEAMTFEEAYSSSTPMAVLIYADWAENYQTYIDNFDGLNNTFGNKLNYVKLNIADKDTKNFNDKYHIYPHLPYVLMFRDSGKVSRYVPRECAATSACLTKSLNSFMN